MMLAMMIFTSSPFDRVLPSLPVDGADLNPLLQRSWSDFSSTHALYGLCGACSTICVLYGSIMGGSLRCSLDTLEPPLDIGCVDILTLGIALGSWWAYHELGWGGWWFWDPVENASLMPWFAATALMHSLAVTEKRGVFKVGR